MKTLAVPSLPACRYGRQLSSDNRVFQLRADDRFQLLKNCGFGSLSLLSGDRVQLNFGTTRLAMMTWTGKEFLFEFCSHGRAEGVDPSRHRDLKWLKEQLSIRKDALPKKYSREGKWHDALSRRIFFKLGSGKQRWVVIDREAVLGFGPKTQGKEPFWQPIREKIGSIADAIPMPTRRWADFDRDKLMEECDFLALSEDKELACLELKRGEASRLYWAPLQALSYHLAFSEALPDISESLKELVLQKVELELLPETVRRFLPSGSFTSLCSAVVIGDAHKVSSEVRRRISHVRNHVGSGIENARSIEILRISEEGNDLVLF